MARGRYVVAMADHPEIETARLRLRQFRAEDLGPHQCRGRRRPRRHLGAPASAAGGQPAPVGRTARRMGPRRLRHVIMEERETGAVIGHCGIQRLEDGNDVEVGCYLGRAGWGRGYGDRGRRGERGLRLRPMRTVAHRRRRTPRQRRVAERAAQGRAMSCPGRPLLRGGRGSVRRRPTLAAVPYTRGQLLNTSLIFSPACLTLDFAWSAWPSASSCSSSVALPTPSLTLPASFLGLVIDLVVESHWVCPPDSLGGALPGGFPAGPS